MKPIIRVENLSKQYRLGVQREAYGSLRESLVRAAKAPFKRLRRNGPQVDETIWALKDVSFEVMPGEVVGIIGRNGAGKSTLLKILSQITEPASGQIDLFGRVGSLLEVGTGFHPELTGRENIYLNGAILGMKRVEIERKFDEIVAFAEVEKFLDTPVKHYSSGMYTRLAFSVAAHLEPEILLVDEVLAVGDALFQKKCMGKMEDVAREGRTVLFVSHNIAAIESLCRTGLLLSGGRLVEQGMSSDVLANYLRSLNGYSNSPELDAQAADRPLRFKDIRVLKNTNDDSVTFQTGDSITISTTVQPKEPLSDIYLGVRLLDEWRKLIFAFHAKEAGLQIGDEIDQEFCLNLEIPRLLLLPGRFYLSLIAADRDGNILQEVPTAFSFDVLPKDLSGSGKPFLKGHGTVLIPFKMSVRCQDREWTGGALL